MTIQDIFPTALTLESCEKLQTPRLLTYYKKYRKIKHYGVCGCCFEILDERDVEPNRIANEYMDAIKSILDKRENV